MIHSIVDEEAGGSLGALLCQLLYCRAEARWLELDLVGYFLDMARLEVEELLSAAESNGAPGLSRRLRSGEAG
ncbi:MAG: hypothetical protein ACLQE9_04285 [Roseiarcus sp.]